MCEPSAVLAKPTFILCAVATPTPPISAACCMVDPSLKHPSRDGQVLYSGANDLDREHGLVRDAASGPQTWQLTMINENPMHGWTFQTTVPYASTLLSAEWIQEAPLDGRRASARELRQGQLRSNRQ